MVNELGLSGNELICFAFLYQSFNKENGNVLHIGELSNSIGENSKTSYCVLMLLRDKGLISFEMNESNNVFTFKILPQECMISNNKKRNVTLKDDAMFEECWKEYKRKGHKNKAKPYWDKLPQGERERIMPHIKAYVSTRERSYQQDFERYLRDKTYDTVVYERNNVVYDPEMFTNNEYRPFLGENIFWDKTRNIHVFFGDVETLYDGYTSENRPNGAKVFQNAYTFVWDSTIKKWVKQ